jgi:lauroyl/myristoyl acyltransferase
MDLQTFFTSRAGTGTLMWLSRNLPPWLGLPVADLVIGLLARRRDSSLVRTLRTNQSVVRNLPVDAPELDAIVRRVLRNAGRGYFEFYHRASKGLSAVEDVASFSPEVESMLQATLEGNAGALIVVLHISNFDLAAVAFATRSIPLQILSYGTPPGGYQLQNELRIKAGLSITPITGPALKAAISRLRKGGTVVVGLDRPLSGIPEVEWLDFFGHPAPLSTGFVRLALATDASMYLTWVEPTGDGTFLITSRPPVDVVRTGSRQEEVRINSRRMLDLAEEVIRAHADEWMMFYPVWPQLLAA